MNSITWFSPQIDDFCDNVYKNIESFDLLIARATDITKYRIEALFTEITNTNVCLIFHIFFFLFYSFYSLIDCFFLNSFVSLMMMSLFF